MAYRSNILDGVGMVRGYMVDEGNQVKYYGMTKGLIGWFDKHMNRWYWASYPQNTRLGPQVDIGPGEVLRSEGAV